jgi:hypothetical protein
MCLIWLDVGSVKLGSRVTLRFEKKQSTVSKKEKEKKQSTSEKKTIIPGSIQESATDASAILVLVASLSESDGLRIVIRTWPETA